MAINNAGRMVIRDVKVCRGTNVNAIGLSRFAINYHKEEENTRRFKENIKVRWRMSVSRRQQPEPEDTKSCCRKLEDTISCRAKETDLEREAGWTLPVVTFK